MIFLKVFEKIWFCQILHGFYTFQRTVFWQKNRVSKMAKNCKKGMSTYTDQISKIAGRSRVPYGSGTRDLTRALAEIFFGFRGLIFPQNWSAFHLSKRQVSSSNRLRVMADWSLAWFFGKNRCFLRIPFRLCNCNVTDTWIPVLFTDTVASLFGMGMKEVMVVLEVGVVVVVVLMLVEGLMVMVEMGRKYLKNGRSYTQRLQ